MNRIDLDTYLAQLAHVEKAYDADKTNEKLQALQAELKELIELAQISIEQVEAAAALKVENRRGGGSAGVSAAIWAAGDECLAKYSGDGGWYPARITFVGGSESNRVYSIVFRGYNTTELVKLSEVKALPANYTGAGPTGLTKKRKLNDEEEKDKERRKMKNVKKLETKAAKAKEQEAKKSTWQKFAKKSEKKGVHIAGVSGTSIFKTPDNPLGRVGVTGSGKGMTEVALRSRHKFMAEDDDAP